MGERKTFRCAVYTRKSSEEGLEQDFNSLEAQREACEAYIRSQEHEGWRLLPDRFDDGGFSGGNMDRPALHQLIGLVESGRVDIIVVYKIDRLTRSLTDFARLTVLAPGETCLSCRGVITPETARGESLRRRNPEDYEQRKREAYVAGEGNPAPSVVTFTTEAACMAVNELIQRLQGFRGPEGSASNRVRKLHLSEDRFPAHKSIETCPVCGSRDCWGRGDVDPFLDRVG